MRCEEGGAVWREDALCSAQIGGAAVPASATVGEGAWAEEVESVAAAAGWAAGAGDAAGPAPGAGAAVGDAGEGVAGAEMGSDAAAVPGFGGASGKVIGAAEAVGGVSRAVCSPLGGGWLVE